MRILNTDELRSVYGGHGKAKHGNAHHKACQASSRRNTTTRRNKTTRRKNTTSRHKVARKY